jgi:hypothetical protein
MPDLDHWSSPNGCHEDCPACAQDNHVCDDCGKSFAEEELDQIKHLTQRVDPGGPMPSGECPCCGALCYQKTLEPERKPAPIAPAELYAAITSLHDAFMRLHKSGDVTEATIAADGIAFLQTMYAVAEKFCRWADENVDWDRNSEVWPYHLQEHFGTEVFRVIEAAELTKFGDAHCVGVAHRMKLPLIYKPQPRAASAPAPVPPAPGPGRTRTPPRPARSAPRGNARRIATPARNGVGSTTKRKPARRPRSTPRRTRSK